MSPALSLPVGFSWLLPRCRPSKKEIKAYAAAIAAREGRNTDEPERLRREAELQLWVWRTEHAQRR